MTMRMPMHKTMKESWELYKVFAKGVPSMNTLDTRLAFFMGFSAAYGICVNIKSMKLADYEAIRLEIEAFDPNGDYDS